MKSKVALWIALILCIPAIVGSGATIYTPSPRYRAQYGWASWYGSSSQGHRMASGKPYNEFAMVAAHRTLPLGTRVRVTNLRNGRSVVVRIMDRGPFERGRAIDLSEASAHLLGFHGHGLVRVKIVVLSTPTQVANANLPHPARREVVAPGGR